MGHGVTQNHYWVSFPLWQPRELERAALGGSWFHTAATGNASSRVKACALIWRAAGPRRGWAEAQLLPGIRPDKPEAESWRLCSFTNAGKKLGRHFSAGGDLGPTAYH